MKLADTKFFAKILSHNFWREVQFVLFAKYVKWDHIHIRSFLETSYITIFYSKLIFHENTQTCSKSLILRHHTRYNPIPDIFPIQDTIVIRTLLKVVECHFFTLHQPPTTHFFAINCIQSTFTPSGKNIHYYLISHSVHYQSLPSYFPLLPI